MKNSLMAKQFFRYAAVGKQLIIFGCGEFAELAHFYFSRDSEYNVAGFTVDANHLTKTTLFNLPIVSFEEISHHYPPENYELFVAIGYSKLNNIRKEKYLAAKELGYRLATFISSKATVLNDHKIGDNCFVFENSVIQPFVTIGNNIILWSGSCICHHSQIADHTFVASNVVVLGKVTIGEQCFIGANATIRDHLTVGNKCIIGAGTLLLRDAPAGGLYIGCNTERSPCQALN